MRLLSIFVSIALLSACGDDDSTADRLGVGAECSADRDCRQSHRDGGLSERCLTQFKGGYCGVENCASQDDCPEDAACVAHTDGRNYCFRTCAEKPECNANRSADNESNCSANVEYVGADKAQVGKACVPPSG